MRFIPGQAFQCTRGCGCVVVYLPGDGRGARPLELATGARHACPVINGGGQRAPFVPTPQTPAPAYLAVSARLRPETGQARAIVALAGLDPDRAHDRNGVGFSAFTSQPGHRLAKKVLRGDSFSPRDQAKLAWILNKHRHQIGALGL